MEQTSIRQMREETNLWMMQLEKKDMKL